MISNILINDEDFSTDHKDEILEIMAHETIHIVYFEIHDQIHK
jgi:hypothetical protein